MSRAERPKLGLALPSFVEDPAIALTVARAAEDAGLDGVFVYDHLFRAAPGGGRRPALEGVALLGAVAQATTRLAVGALVFRAWLRPAASLAAAVATVDRIAPGRVIATIGAGDSESKAENESFGLGFGSMADRVGALESAVLAARRASAATVWVGGQSSAVREIAAAAADGWNSWGDAVEPFAAMARATRASAAPGFECSWGGIVVVAVDDDAAGEKAARLGAPQDAIVGGPARVARRLRDYADAGADWVLAAPVDSSDPGNARLLGEHVVPLVAG
jgi:alkanesulfonate monooxygenase SsuD/methylene tetrahydromethanopterin reductase-like flavin-dependent oxidoreductase (luciferase family)